MVALSQPVSRPSLQTLLDAIPERILEELAKSLPGLQYGEITLYFVHGKFKRLVRVESKQIE